LSFTSGITLFFFPFDESIAGASRPSMRRYRLRA
jgi:hypothetical protein